MSQETDAAIAAELALLDPRIRSDRVAVDALLHPDFVEVGASGRLWTRSELLDAIGEFPSSTGDPVRATDVTAHVVAPGIVLVRYVTTTDRRVHRSSLWLSTDDGWRVIHHQGTPAL